MKANNKAKWMVGITGAAFSAFVIGQLNTNPNPEVQQIPTTAMAVEISDSMSEREKKLVGLDWSDFSPQERTITKGQMKMIVRPEEHKEIS